MEYYVQVFYRNSTTDWTTVGESDNYLSAIYLYNEACGEVNADRVSGVRILHDTGEVVDYCDIISVGKPKRRF